MQLDYPCEEHRSRQQRKRDPYTHFIKPTIFCFDDFEQQKGLKAEIDLLPFVELCDALAQQFA